MGKFKVDKLPALIVVKDPADGKGDIYKGELKMSEIKEFLQTYAKKKANYQRKVELQLLTWDAYSGPEGLCNKHYASASTICLIIFSDK